MAPTRHPSRNHRKPRWMPGDLLLRRVIAIVLVSGGVFLAYSTVFTDFQQRVLSQWEFENGERIPIIHITCPSPWSVVVDRAEPDGVVLGDLCVLPARGRLIQGAAGAMVALILGAWMLTRSNEPGPLPELPLALHNLRRQRSDSG